MSEKPTTLDAMAERAQRQLDGMTVNRDAMARDVLALVTAIKAAQARAESRQWFDDLWNALQGNKA